MRLGVRKSVRNQTVYFRCEDKVVFAEATDSVCCKIDGEDPVARQMEIGMVLLLFGEFRDAIESPQSLNEISKTKRSADRFSRFVELPIS